MGCFGSKEKLSKEDLEFLKTHTRYDEQMIKEWYKGFRQDCPSGRLTPDKFVDMYKMFFPSGNAEEFCDHVFRTFDMDKNGYIDFKPDPARPGLDLALINWPIPLATFWRSDIRPRVSPFRTGRSFERLLGNSSRLVTLSAVSYPCGGLVVMKA
ncbi:neuronal calcium sensor 2-like [Penaeus indicus]|uniref:neuronal calcium sensor 2-like n=1 Tax=Penaeus indicus TaxID=29960 RepID=UPI00300C1ACA